MDERFTDCEVTETKKTLLVKQAEAKPARQSVPRTTPTEVEPSVPALTRYRLIAKTTPSE